MKLSDLDFPVASFAKDNITFYARDINELTTCSSVGFKNGFYNNLIIVDSRGTKCKVIRAVKAGTVGPFWGFSLLHGRWLRVNLELAKMEEELSLNDFKDKILTVFKKDEFFWDSGGELNELKQFVINANSFKEIISQLCKVFYKES
jgi:hypothetical protein